MPGFHRPSHNYKASVSFIADATSTTSSHAVIASTNTMTIMSTSSPATITVMMDISTIITNSVTTPVRKHPTISANPENNGKI